MVLGLFAARAGDLMAWARRASLRAAVLPCGCRDLRGCALPPLAERPEDANVLVLSGPVNKKRAEEARAFYERMGDPKWVIALGACASSGGLSEPYAVKGGADLAVPVDLCVPGCPPSAGDLALAIERLATMIRRPERTGEDDQGSD